MAEPNEPEREPEPPTFFDRWLIALLSFVAVFAAYGGLKVLGAL
ncbi:MAG: hypothetical protein ABMA14_20310 [Hyphomonadaceae bacterium]